MKNIDESRLESDLAYRFAYLSEFMEFGEDEVQTLHDSATLLGPLVPSLVDAVYDKLFSFDATKRHFVSRQSGYDGPVPESLDELAQDHEMIQFRKQHLGRYITNLVTNPYDDKMVKYLDAVGSMHTPKTGSRDLDIPLVQMNALMGFVSHAILNAILESDLESSQKNKAVCAFNKVLWLQNDLIVRHYEDAPAMTA